MITRRSFLEMLVGSAIAIPCRARADTNPFVSIERYSTNRNAPVLVDPVYATSRNFMGRIIPGYEAAKAWSYPLIVEDLIQVNEVLRKDGLQLLVKDGYRPIQASEAMMQWGRVKERERGEKYVGKWVAYVSREQGKYSGHNYGTTIDLTLATLDGQEVWMGSQFDEFSHHSEFYNARAKNNDDDDMAFAGKGYFVHQSMSTLQLRELLRSAMSTAFNPYSSAKERTAEWWHFSSKSVSATVPYNDAIK